MTNDIDVPPPTVLREFQHEVMDRPADRFVPLHVRAVVGASGNGVDLGYFAMSAAEARDLAASLLLAADVVDPHCQERLT